MANSNSHSSEKPRKKASGRPSAGNSAAPKKGKPGRPPKQIDGELVEKLAGIGCTTEEIATVVGCSKDTLERRYRKRLEGGRSKARASLRRIQFESAMGGNVTMMIWLGKQMLGQSDFGPEPGEGEDVVPTTRTIKVRLTATGQVAADAEES